MGTICHNSIIVTGDNYPEAAEMLKAVHTRAKTLFGELVSPIIETKLNGFLSFFVAPDGSKEAWEESEIGDRNRRILCDYIDTFAYEDGSNSIKYVDVSYGATFDGDRADVERTNVIDLEEEP